MCLAFLPPDPFSPPDPFTPIEVTQKFNIDGALGHQKTAAEIGSGFLFYCHSPILIGYRVEKQSMAVFEVRLLALIGAVQVEN